MTEKKGSKKVVKKAVKRKTVAKKRTVKKANNIKTVTKKQWFSFMQLLQGNTNSCSLS